MRTEESDAPERTPIPRGGANSRAGFGKPAVEALSPASVEAARWKFPVRENRGREGMTRHKLTDEVVPDNCNTLRIADEGEHQEEDAAKRKLERLKKLIHTLLAEVGATGYLQGPCASGISFYEEVQRFEISLIRTALSRTGGHQRRAARLLGIKPTTLNNKIKFYNIDIRATLAEPESDTCDSR